MSALKFYVAAALDFAPVIAASSSVANANAHWTEPGIPGASEQALVLGRDHDGDGGPDEITIRLEMFEVTEEVYPGEVVKFWLFAPDVRNTVANTHIPTQTNVGTRVYRAYVCVNISGMKTKFSAREARAGGSI